MYLEEFGSEFDWEDNLDDIWWQEILVMLFGITKRPDERMRALLDRLPQQPVLCPQLGPALAKALFEAPYSSCSNTSDVLERFDALDPSSFYGLKGVVEESGGDGNVLLTKLAGCGLLDPKKEPSRALSSELEELSPEPDANPDRERVRRWLEDQNVILLDRLELGCECYRNALTRIEQGPAGEATRNRLVATLSSFSRDGNMWETVRAIQTAARLPGIDLAAVVDPVLKKDAWCRREAMSAVAKYPFDAAGGRGLVGFILFVLFMQGGLFTSLPQFARAVWERPRLGWYVPGVLLLTTLSLAVVLSPLGLSPVLENSFEVFGQDPNPLLGLSVMSLSLSALCCVPIYFAKLYWGVPILRLTLLACALIFVASKVQPHIPKSFFEDSPTPPPKTLTPSRRRRRDSRSASLA